jgi:MoaA/NifB/PqqE/SkfB family radical SAM enzyme
MITAKQVLTNKCFCPMPWAGLMYNFDGTVKNCIRSAGPIGNVKNNSIEEILHGAVNADTQQSMLQDQPGSNCYPCYELEGSKQKHNIVSDRIFYIKELKRIPLDVYRPGNHELNAIDVRWSNLCNFACVYCSPEYSSQWASELKVFAITPDNTQKENFKKYIFDHAPQLKHVYLAGGEPLLMKENLELLERLQQTNPDVNLRINTNLSKVDTKVFDLICEFKNVHWTVSVETMDDEFEYIRYGGRWQDFLDNLSRIKQLDHKISFNMLWFLLNYKSLFDCVDFFRAQGFHPNSFVIGALLTPLHLNIRHLPNTVLKSLEAVLVDRIEQHPGYLLEDSYTNLLRYIQQPFDKTLEQSLTKIAKLDQRRGIDSKKIFKDLYKLI